MNEKLTNAMLPKSCIKAQANDKGKREKMRTKPAKVILFFRAIHLEQFSNINSTNSNSKHRTVKSNRKRHRALAFSNNRWKRIIIDRIYHIFHIHEKIK